MGQKIDKAIEYVRGELECLDHPRTYGDDDEYWARKQGKVDMLEEVLSRLKLIQNEKD